jgi:3-oxoacyl-[acyl-carrier-protein] synthase-3
MLGITEISSYVPSKKVSNYDRMDYFGLSEDFIENKIGIHSLSIKDSGQKSSDMCVKVYENLLKKINNNITEKIDCCIVVTQNPDYNIPHVSAIVHGKLGFSNQCACFDISLGCSGYTYGLSVIFSFMKSNKLKNGLLFTSDQYSEIIDNKDKNTSLIFGDGSTVTYVSNKVIFKPIQFDFGTNGSMYKELLCDNSLYMNGRSIFNFTAVNIPIHIKKMLDKSGMFDSDIDKYILHQASKYIVDTITERLNVNRNKVPFDISDYGNTVSSSIPFILEKEMYNENNNIIVLSGYGVGLSWGGSIIIRDKK